MDGLLAVMASDRGGRMAVGEHDDAKRKHQLELMQEIGWVVPVNDVLTANRSRVRGYRITMDGYRRLEIVKEAEKERQR